MPEQQDRTKITNAVVEPHNEHAMTAHARLQVAFQSLPQSWQTLLWYVDVMQEPPGRIGTLMSINANDVQDLTGRARTGLWEAYPETTVES